MADLLMDHAKAVITVGVVAVLTPPRVLLVLTLHALVRADGDVGVGGSLARLVCAVEALHTVRVLALVALALGKAIVALYTLDIWFAVRHGARVCVRTSGKRGMREEREKGMEGRGRERKGGEGGRRGVSQRQESTRHNSPSIAASRGSVITSPFRSTSLPSGLV